MLRAERTFGARSILVFCDGRPLTHCCAVNVVEGWADQWVIPICRDESGRRLTTRVYGNIELRLTRYPSQEAVELLEKYTREVEALSRSCDVSEGDIGGRVLHGPPHDVLPEGQVD